MAKILIGQPCINGLVHTNCLKTMQTMTYEHELMFSWVENCSLIVKGRNDIFSKFVHNSEADYLLFVDADLIITPPGCLDQMIKKQPKNSIIGGLYAMKAHDVTTGHPPLNGVTLDGNSNIVMDGRVIEMKYIPNGFMLISKEVALKLIECYKDLEYQDHILGQCWNLFGLLLHKNEKTNQINMLPEDFSFCQRAKDVGINIFADTGVQLGHLGTFMYTLEHLFREPEKPKSQITYMPMPKTISECGI